MITDAHPEKSLKSLQTLKDTIYVLTSGRVIVSVQIHNAEKKALKGVKMTTAKWTINTGAQQDLRYPAAKIE
jgi:hypothetical protein